MVVTQMDIHVPQKDQSRYQQRALNINTLRYRDESIHHDSVEKSKNGAEGGGVLEHVLRY
jgi:hypothetical protein